MSLPERIVAEAETWVKTPFRHQGRLKGIGVDCAFFVANVANVARGPEAEPIVIPDNYRPREDGRIMMKLLVRNADFILPVDRQPGDVLALIANSLTEPTKPRHLVFVQRVTDATTFIIHVTENVGVAFHRMNAHWNKRIHSCWRLRE